MNEQLSDYYWTKFENRFLKLTREDFQAWFAEIMSCAYFGDFVATRQGTSKGGGDMNCDGFRKSTGTVYAVYAPRNMELSELKLKIREDFEGALKSFGDRMQEWVFVHNEVDERLSTEIVLVLADLKKDHSAIRIESHIGKKELWEIVRKLEPRSLHQWFPEPPTNRHMEQLGLTDLQPVLRFLERQPIPVDVPTDAPDQDKLEYNTLSPMTKGFLQLGRLREQLVKQYFDGCSDIELGESIAQSFRDRFQTLHRCQWDSNAIFEELYEFAGGLQFRSLTGQAAVYAVLSYFFERCDIFLNPPRVES